MATRKPARVLPDPVGAAMRVSWAEAIRGQPRDCGGVGPSGNRRRNHSATAGWNSRTWGDGAAGCVPELNTWTLSRRGNTSATPAILGPNRRSVPEIDPNRPGLAV